MLRAGCAQVVPVRTLVFVMIFRPASGTWKRRLWVSAALVRCIGTGRAHHHAHATFALCLTLAPRPRLCSLAPLAFLSPWKGVVTTPHVASHWHRDHHHLLIAPLVHFCVGLGSSETKCAVMCRKSFLGTFQDSFFDAKSKSTCNHNPTSCLPASSGVAV